MKLQDTYDIFKKFDRCCSVLEVDTVVCEILEVFGVEYYFVGSMPPIGSSQADCLEHVLGSLLPDFWADRYFRHNFVHFDPTIHHVRTNDNILNWKNVDNSSKIAATIMGDAASIGLREGVTIPQSSLDGIKIGTSFSGNQLDLDNPKLETCVKVVSANLVSALFKVGKREQSNPIVNLTGREKDVISWISEGFTSSQIGKKLNISNATVEKHYRQVLKKFNCKTRSHVVAEALRQNIIV